MVHGQYFLDLNCRTGEIAQWLQEYTALTEDPCQLVQITVTRASGGPMTVCLRGLYTPTYKRNYK